MKMATILLSHRPGEDLRVPDLRPTDESMVAAAGRGIIGRNP
jgi:hypothetical protein